MTFIVDEAAAAQLQQQAYYRRVMEMTYENAEDYLIRAQEAADSFDSEGRKEGIRQFIDEKSYKPGLGTYDVTRKVK